MSLSEKIKVGWGMIYGPTMMHVHSEDTVWSITLYDVPAVVREENGQQGQSDSSKISPHFL